MTNLPPAISEPGGEICHLSFCLCHAGTLAFLPDALRRNLDIGARIDPAWPIRRGPSNAISDHLSNLRLPVGRKCLVAWPEIENLPGAAPPTTTRSEDFSTLEPGNKD